MSEIHTHTCVRCVIDVGANVNAVGDAEEQFQCMSADERSPERTLVVDQCNLIAKHHRSNSLSLTLQWCLLKNNVNDTSHS